MSWKGQRWRNTLFSRRKFIKTAAIGIGASTVPVSVALSSPIDSSMSPYVPCGINLVDEICRQIHEDLDRLIEEQAKRFRDSLDVDIDKSSGLVHIQCKLPIMRPVEPQQR